MRRSYRDQDIKLLFSRAHDQCSAPGCTVRLTADPTGADDAVVVGEIAHIVSPQPIGPRHDPDYPREKLNNYENLVLLCPTHHTLVDRQDSAYDADELRRWKTEHECHMLSLLRAAVPSVSFPELEQVIDAVLAATPSSSSGFHVVPPADKMRENSLSQYTSTYLTIGMALRREVEEYLRLPDIIGTNVAGRLTAGFVREYERLRTEGYRGDYLFEALTIFAGLGRPEQRIKAAGLAVLTYLFEKCEVFES